MSIEFSEHDERFMKVAIDQAGIALDTGNYPVGAALVVNGELVAAGYNLKDTKRDSISHAEMLLFADQSARLKEHYSSGPSQIELYSSLAPCIMCLGTAVVHRTVRIVAACEEPRTNVLNIDPTQLGERFAKEWPQLHFGLMRDESLDLLIGYFSRKQDDYSVEKHSLLEEMRDSVVSPELSVA